MPHVAFVETVFPGMGQGPTPNPIAGQYAGRAGAGADADAQSSFIDGDADIINTEDGVVVNFEDGSIEGRQDETIENRLDRIFDAGTPVTGERLSSTAPPHVHISQRLTRNREPRDAGPPAMTVGDLRPPGKQFAIYLCSGPRRPADLAEPARASAGVCSMLNQK